MAHLFQPSLIPAIDSNGRTISGAQLHFYLSNTLKPTTIYTTHLETVAHTNPVVANSGGRFPPVYLNETQIHRVRMTDGHGVLLPHCDIDPVNVYDPLGPVVRYYRFGGFAVAPPTSSEILTDHVVTDDFMLPADMLGAVASVGTPPASDWVLDVQRNGESIGSVAIARAGFASFVTVNRQPVSVEAGDVISCIAPAAVDPLLARLRYTLKGTL